MAAKAADWELIELLKSYGIELGESNCIWGGLNWKLVFGKPCCCLFVDEAEEEEAAAAAAANKDTIDDTSPNIFIWLLLLILLLLLMLELVGFRLYVLSTKEARLFGNSLLLKDEEDDADDDWVCGRFCGIWVDEGEELSLINCSMLSLKLKQ